MAVRQSGPPGVLSVAEAQEAVDELGGEITSLRNQIAEAEGVHRGLELRVVEDGDETITAAELAEARHVVDMRHRRLEKLTARLTDAQQALRLARAHEAVDGWEELAPALKAQIREQAATILGAREAIERLVGQHNSASLTTQAALRGIQDPGRRFQVVTFGHSFAGTQALAPILAQAVIDASLAKTRPAQLTGVPSECLPHGPQAPPGSLAVPRDPPPPAPRPPELTESQLEAAVTRGHVRRSPFVRRDKEA